MKKLNVILVYNSAEDKLLMCKREKEPYKGKFNLVGGKVEADEDELYAAYRELQEETGITPKDINLKHVMDFKYYNSDTELEIYAGKLERDVKLVKEINELYWVDKAEAFYNLDKFAGEGNIWHMLHHVETHKDEILN